MNERMAAADIEQHIHKAHQNHLVVDPPYFSISPSISAAGRSDQILQAFRQDI